MYLKLYPLLLQQFIAWKKFVSVYIDNGLTMFESRCELIATIKKTPDAVESPCVIHREAPGSGPYLLP